MTTPKPTKGPWSAVRSLTCGHLRAGHNYQKDPKAEWTDADIALINDAGNTYATTGLTPSELVNMLLECLPYVEEAEQFNKPMCRGLGKRISALSLNTTTT